MKLYFSKKHLYFFYIAVHFSFFPCVRPEGNATISINLEEVLDTNSSNAQIISKLNNPAFLRLFLNFTFSIDSPEVKRNNALTILFALIEKNKDLLFHLTNRLINHVVLLSKSEEGNKILKLMLDHYAQDIKNSINSSPGVSLLKEMSTQFCQIIQSDPGIQLLEYIIDNFEKSKDLFVDSFLENFVSFLSENSVKTDQEFNRINFISKLLHDDNQQKKLLITLKKNSETIIQAFGYKNVENEFINLVIILSRKKITIIYIQELLKNIHNKIYNYDELSSPFLQAITYENHEAKTLISTYLINDTSLWCKNPNAEAFAHFIHCTLDEIHFKADFFKPLLYNFIYLVQYEYGRLLLETLMIKGAITKEIIIKCFEKNCIILGKFNDHALDELIKLLKKYCDIESILREKASVNFIKSCNSFILTNQLIQLIKDTTKSSLLFEHILLNFAEYMQTPYGYLLINAFLKEGNKKPETIILLQNNFTELCLKAHGVFNFWLKKNKTIIPEFIPLIYENFSNACNIKIFFKIILDDYSIETKKLLIKKLIINNFKTLSKSLYGNNLLDTCLFTSIEINDFNFINKIFKQLKSNFNELYPTTITIVSSHFQNNEKLNKIFSKENKNPKADYILKTAHYLDFCQNEKITLNKNLNTKSIKHYRKLLTLHYLDTTNDSILNKLYLIHCLQINVLFENKDLMNLFDKVLLNEQKFQEKGYYTFIHAQNNRYLPYEELHTFINTNLSNNKSKNYLYLHVKSNESDLVKEKKLRKKLLTQGRKTFYDRSRLLFLNSTFFGNATNPGSCSFKYILNNNNINEIPLSWKKIFELNNASALYPKYQSVLDQLHKEFVALSQFGTCFFIAIPKEKIHKELYLAQPGGLKKKIFIEGVGETDDIKIILETLENNPEKIADFDQMEFCLPMTFDKHGGLNPESGIKVFGCVAADQEKLDAYYVKQKELFIQIKQDIDLLNHKPETSAKIANPSTFRKVLNMLDEINPF